MRSQISTVVYVCASALALAAASANAADLPRLPSLNAAPAETSVSGISSGAFMAVQFATAWSSTVKGVGVVSGGPYFCAQGQVADAIGPCMKGPAPDLTALYNSAAADAASGRIDPLANLARQKVYVFHGYNDAVVSRPVTDATAAFYRHYQSDAVGERAGGGNVFYQTAIGAGHSFVVLNGQGSDAQALNGCKDNHPPYIDQCGYDQAGVLLQHIYGALNGRNDGALTGSLKSFSQTAYMGNETPETLNMGAEGYVFVPKACDEGAACRVHIALHGCKQNAETLGRTFVEHTGYLNWADTNRIVILFPQSQASKHNPAACWDWWGYTGGGYATKSGRQISVIKTMLDALTSGAKPAQSAEKDGCENCPGDMQFRVQVTDLSDTSAALAWPAVAGARSYDVTRLGPDGTPVTSVSVSAPGFADTGLAPSTTYRWRGGGGQERHRSPACLGGVGHYACNARTLHDTRHVSADAVGKLRRAFIRPTTQVPPYAQHVLTCAFAPSKPLYKHNFSGKLRCNYITCIGAVWFSPQKVQPRSYGMLFVKMVTNR